MVPEIDKYLPLESEIIPIERNGMSESEMQEGYKALMHVLSSRSSRDFKIVYRVSRFEKEIKKEELDEIKEKTEEERKDCLSRIASDLYWADEVFLVGK